MLAREIHIHPFRVLLVIMIAMNSIVGVYDFYLMIKLIILAFLGCLITYWVNIPLKILFKTKRPRMDKYQEIIYGFPSLHTQFAFTIVTIYSFFVNLFFIPSFIFATFVGISRLMTKSHEFFDVITGSILGVLVGIFIIILA